MTTDTFIAGKGFLYTLDPRAKVLVWLCAVSFFFWPIRLCGLVFMVALLFVLSLYGVGGKATLRVLRSILPMLVFMVVFMPFGFRTGRAMWTVGGFPVVTWEAFWQTLLLMSRFVGITYSCTLFLSTTKMHQVMLAFLWYRIPYKTVLVITLAFTYIPFVSDSFHEISDSHRLRQASGKTRRTPLRDMLPTLTSALVVSLRGIPYLAMSLEQRGYGRKGKRSVYHDLSGYHHAVPQTLLAVLVFGTCLYLFR